MERVNLGSLNDQPLEFSAELNMMGFSMESIKNGKRLLLDGIDRDIILKSLIIIQKLELFLGKRWTISSNSSGGVEVKWDSYGFDVYFSIEKKDGDSR